jgi:hypothetical protein
MRLLSVIVSMTALVAAAPSQGLLKRQGALIGPLPAQGQVECGDTSRAYCFDEVVWGKSMSCLLIIFTLQATHADLAQTKITRHSSTATAKSSSLRML